MTLVTGVRESKDFLANYVTKKKKKRKKKMKSLLVYGQSQTYFFQTFAMMIDATELCSLILLPSTSTQLYKKTGTSELIF